MAQVGTGHLLWWKQVSGEDGGPCLLFLELITTLDCGCCCCCASVFIIIFTKRGRMCNLHKWAQGPLHSKMAPCLSSQPCLPGATVMFFPGRMLSSKQSGWEQGVPERGRDSLWVLLGQFRQGGLQGVAEGTLGLQKERGSQKLGRLEEQLPSSCMTSVGGCGERSSGLPPIPVCSCGSRSMPISTCCLLDGFSRRSRVLQREITSSSFCWNLSPLPCGAL